MVLVYQRRKSLSIRIIDHLLLKVCSIVFRLVFYSTRFLLSLEKKEAIIWGPTGVEPWSASMITGIDWKSLTIPASLPTTFDVAPSAEELQRDYNQNYYTLIPDLSPKYQSDSRRRSQQNGHQQVDKV